VDGRLPADGLRPLRGLDHKIGINVSNATKPSSELKNTTYELFIAALSILSIANLFIYLLATDPDVEGVLVIMDWILSFIFLIDFLFRIFSAESKSTYFFRQFGWADLLASMPFPQAKLLRLFRLGRAGRMIHKYGASNLAREFLGNRGGSALLTLLFFMILVLEFGGMAILAAENKSPDANIKTASDSLWYIYVTITTVGYGDRYPITEIGRIVGIVVLTTGIGLFGTLTGFLANAFLAPAKEEDAGESNENATDEESQPESLPLKLAELQKLLAEQQKAQSAVQAKLVELEEWLQQHNLDSSVAP
jgi:voltage-gated potassium channel